MRSLPLVRSLSTLTILSAVACSDAPVGPRRVVQQVVAARASRDSITPLGNGAFLLTVHHPCTSAAGALDFGNVLRDSSAARLMAIDRGPRCGCPWTIPTPPGWPKTYVCTLVSWECDDHSSGCNYKCAPPVIVWA